MKNSISQDLSICISAPYFSNIEDLFSKKSCEDEAMNDNCSFAIKDGE